MPMFSVQHMGSLKKNEGLSKFTSYYEITIFIESLSPKNCIPVSFN